MNPIPLRFLLALLLLGGTCACGSAGAAVGITADLSGSSTISLEEETLPLYEAFVTLSTLDTGGESVECTGELGFDLLTAGLRPAAGAAPDAAVPVDPADVGFAGLHLRFSSFNSDNKIFRASLAGGGLDIVVSRATEDALPRRASLSLLVDPDASLFQVLSFEMEMDSGLRVRASSGEVTIDGLADLDADDGA